MAYVKTAARNAVRMGVVVTQANKSHAQYLCTYLEIL